MMIDKERNRNIPKMSAEAIQEQADNMLFNGVGFAIAQAGLERANDLARLMNTMGHDSNVLETVANILERFDVMHVECGLTHDGEFSASIKFTLHEDLRNGETLQ